MRADRLVATLLLLQTRGQVTAAQVAAELEVSERTARRDLEGLALAGLPVYSVAGRGGGWRLVGDGRTDLSGLTAAEVRALFLVAGPAQASRDVRAALRKLTRALPEPMRASAETAAASLVVDRPGWWSDAPPDDPPHLDALQTAVVDARELRLDYIAGDGRPSTRVVQPLGLVSKGTRWYLVADTDAGLRTFRVDRVVSTAQTGNPSTRPADFDLTAAWELVRVRVASMTPAVTATGWADPAIIGVCRAALGHRLSIGPPGPDGRVAVELTATHHRSLAGQVAGFGGAVEITAPTEVRDQLAQIGRELVGRYSTNSSR